MQEFWEWTLDVLVRWNQDANRIASENPLYLIVILSLMGGFLAYYVWESFWFYTRYVWYRFTHWRRKTVGRQLRNHNAREFFADGMINLVNYMWLTGMITKKERNQRFARMAYAFDEPDFLPPKPAKPLSKGAQNHKKKMLQEGNGKLVGPSGQLPGDKPEQYPEEATKKSMPKRGKVVVFG